MCSSMRKWWSIANRFPHAYSSRLLPDLWRTKWSDLSRKQTSASARRSVQELDTWGWFAHTSSSIPHYLHRSFSVGRSGQTSTWTIFADSMETSLSSSSLASVNVFDVDWWCTLSDVTSNFIRDVRPHLFFVQLKPPCGDQFFPFTEHLVTKFTKNERDIFDKKNTKIQQCCLNKNAVSAYSNADWIVTWHPLNLCGPLKKNIDDPTSSWSAVPFWRVVAQNDVRQIS